MHGYAFRADPGGLQPFAGVPAHWQSGGGDEYELKEGSRETRGTDIILHVSDDAKEFLSEYKLKEIMRKYCSFMPVNVYFEKASEEKSDSESKPINDPNPLWLKPTSECTNEEYIEFYHNVF